MSVIQSQGYRRDLNLEETPNDNVALDNLMGIGINEDLRFIQNNLRNASSIPYNNVVGGPLLLINSTFDPIGSKGND